MMKTHSRQVASPPANRRSRFVLSAALGLSLTALSPSARAIDLYWDINGTADSANGTTTTATGNWNGTTTNFNTDSTGGAGGTLTATTTNADLVHFSAGTTATGSFTVTLSGGQSAQGILFEEGTVTLAGSTLTLGNGTVGSGTVDVASGRTATIGTTIVAGTSGLTKTGAGTLLLGLNTGTTGPGNTFTGDVFINEGTLVANSSGGGGNAGLGVNNVTLGAGGALNATLQLNRNQNYLSTSQTVTVSAGTGTLRIGGGPTLTLNQQPSILAPVALNGALTLGNGAGGSVGGVAFRGAITGSSTITIDGANAGTTTSGSASASEGAGTLAILNADNSATLTSTINVSRGGLRISAAGSGGTGTINVNGAGGIANISGSGTALGNVFVTNGNVIAPGNNTVATGTAGNLQTNVAGTLGLGTGTGSTLTISSASLFYDLAATATTGNDLVNTDSLTLGGPLTFNINGLTGTLDTTAAYTLINSVNAVNGFNANNITTNFLGALAGQYQASYSINGTNDLVVMFAPVPEPSTWAMIAGGGGLLIVWQRLRRRAA